MTRYSVKSPSRGGARKGAGRKPGSQFDEKTKKMRNAFSAQKCNANIRGIEWQFTLEEYIAWWGDDFDRRGRNKESLVMARHGDTGPYHPDNVYKATPYQNMQEAHMGKKRSDEFRELKRQQAIAQHAKRKEIICKNT